MPRGDGTGPWGQGPMTGRGLGYCSGYERPGFMTPRPGMGLGRGMGAGWTPGRGMGMGRGRFAGFQGYPYPQMMPYGTPPPYAYPQNFPQSYPQDQAQDSQETSRKQSEKKQK